MKKYKIVICGGHLSPALAIIEKLKGDNNFTSSLHYFGRKNALEGDNSLSLEYITLAKFKIPFYSIVTGRLQRSFSIYTLSSLIKIPVGLIQSFYHLYKLKPDIVISFGGYVALPVCIAAYILRVPILTHEQTYVLGLTNRIIGRLGAAVCLSWEVTTKVPHNMKTIYTGLPIRNSIRQLAPTMAGPADKNKKFVNFGDLKLPLIYITGGSLGSRSINSVVQQILPNIAKRFRILHQTGTSSNNSDYNRLNIIKNSLTDKENLNYKLVAQVDPDQIGRILRNSYIVIGRSGASSVAEIATFKVPAIFIPLPWSADNEQEKNAAFLEEFGLAKVLKQEKLDRNTLLDLIDYLDKNINFFRANYSKNQGLFKSGATDEIVTLIKGLISNAKV